VVRWPTGIAVVSHSRFQVIAGSNRNSLSMLRTESFSGDHSTLLGRPLSECYLWTRSCQALNLKFVRPVNESLFFLMGPPALAPARL